MEITEVRVKLVALGEDRLRAFCSITIDNDFVVRDLKVIEGAKGPFVAMPSRKLMSRCRCGRKNSHIAMFCNFCGRRLPARREERESADRAKLHADIAHPINSNCRSRIQDRVLAAYEEELIRSREPGYRGVDFDDFDSALAEDEFDAFDSRALAGIPERKRSFDGSSALRARIDDGEEADATRDGGDDAVDRVGARRADRGLDGASARDERHGGRVAERGRGRGLGGGGATSSRDVDFSPARRPPAPPPLDDEPEDNFGEGLLS